MTKWMKLEAVKHLLNYLDRGRITETSDFLLIYKYVQLNFKSAQSVALF